MTLAAPTPTEFAALMRQLVATAPDQREILGGGVGIMFETLRRLGYTEGLAVWFQATEPRN